MEKQADGSCVFRNAEMEDRARRCYEQQKEGAMERLCAKLQVEMEREDATASEWVTRLAHGKYWAKWMHAHT